MPHALGRRHTPRDIVNRALLVGGKRKRHVFRKRLTGCAVDSMRASRRIAQFRLRLPHQMHFEREHFLIYQTAARLGLFGHINGKMNRAQDLGARHEAILCAKRSRKRVVHAPKLSQGATHDAAHLPLGHLFGSSMHGNHLTRNLFDVVAIDFIEERHGHAQKAVIEFNLACNAHTHAGSKRFHKPWLLEKRHDKRARAIDECHLYQVELRLGAFEHSLVHRGHDSGVFANARLANGANGGHIQITLRVMRKHAANRRGTKTRQSRRPARRNTRDRSHGCVESQGGGQAVRHDAIMALLEREHDGIESLLAAMRVDLEVFEGLFDARNQGV